MQPGPLETVQTESSEQDDTDKVLGLSKSARRKMKRRLAKEAQKQEEKEREVEKFEARISYP